MSMTSGLSQVHFLCLVSGKLIKSKVHDAESEKWHTFCAGHPKFSLAGVASTHMSSYQYWSLTFDYPELVKHFHL